MLPGHREGIIWAKLDMFNKGYTKQLGQRENLSTSISIILV